MKKLLFLFVFTHFVGFAQDTANAKIEKPLKPAVVYEKSGAKVLSYDFNAFESAYLDNKDETVYVVNFWATWCAPCIKELPYFEKLNAAYKNKNVRVILVSLDMRKQIESKLLAFIKQKNLQSKVVHLYAPDADAWISKVDPSWSGAIPATVIYTKGQRKFYERSFTYEELENEVKSFIHEVKSFIH